MTRALVITTWFPDEQHPARTPFCLAHVKALQAVGIEVEVMHVQLGSLESSKHEQYEGVSVRRLALSSRRPLAWMRTAFEIVRGLGRCEVLHTMAFSSVLVAAGPWVLRRRPWIHTEHWSGIKNPATVGGWWQRLAHIRHMLRLAHVVTGVTQELADAMARFARSGATTVVPCVVRVPPHLAKYPPMEPLRLVAVGRVTADKNPLLAVSTVGWLRDQGLHVRYTWVGDGPLLEEARRLVLDLELERDVAFIGAVAPDLVRGVIETAHLFFVPTRHENFFTALAEAIIAGRPGVVPLAGGFVEYCCPENSELTDSWSVEDLGSAILRARDRFRAALPSAVSATLADAFSEEAVGMKFLGLYTRLLHSRP